jgi:hypothetical protein
MSGVTNAFKQSTETMTDVISADARSSVAAIAASAWATLVALRKHAKKARTPLHEGKETDEAG